MAKLKKVEISEDSEEVLGQEGTNDNAVVGGDTRTYKEILQELHTEMSKHGIHSKEQLENILAKL